jgi:dTDP-glucose pyrophosphorylase
MKALILAAGRGTRMKELTNDLPKPMIPVQGVPILETILRRLHAATGIRDVGIIIGYKGQVIRDYFGDGSRLGLDLHYFEQTVIDGTGKAPEVARAWLGEDRFFLACGDVLMEESDLSKIAQNFGADGVIAVKAGEDLTKGGAVVLNTDDYMIDLIEKSPNPPPNAYYNAAFYGLTPRIFEFTARLEKSPRGEYEFTDAMKALVQAGGQVRGVILQQGMVDVRDPGVVAELNREKS